MQTFDSPSALAAAIRERGASSIGIVAIEGASGSGKSTLAKDVGQRLGAAIVSTDDYYRRGMIAERYQDALKANELKNDVLDHRMREDGVVLEGICLRDTLHQMEMSADVFVYCKRLSPAGVWNDDPDLYVEPPGEPVSGQDRIDRWSQRYHTTVTPHTSADMLFEWREDAL